MPLERRSEEGGLVWKADFHGRVHREQKVVSKLL